MGREGATGGERAGGNGALVCGAALHMVESLRGDGSRKGRLHAGTCEGVCGGAYS
jgi:hypothetical protein